MLKPDGNQSTTSKLTMQWFKSKAYCMQFWYIVTSESSINVVIDANKSMVSLWSMRSRAIQGWSFVQLEIPERIEGQLQIVGYTSRGFVAVDDIRFIQTSCPLVTTQNMDQNPLELSTNISDKISYIVPRSQTHPWQCLRFSLNNVKKYFKGKLVVSFKTRNSTIKDLTYTSIPNKLVFNQVSLPPYDDHLQLIIGRIPAARVATYDNSYSTYPCKSTPAVDSSMECIEYETLERLDRRKDQKSKYLAYDISLSTTSWYRISGLAGNQIANECVNLYKACFTFRRGWIQGNMPAEEEGRVKRTLCIHRFSCCHWRITTTIRNCGGYFVYKFASSFGDKLARICTEYVIPKITIEEEWKGWSNGSQDKKFKVIYDKTFNEIAKSIYDFTGRIKDPQANTHQDVGVRFNNTASLRVPARVPSDSMTVCFWLSANNTVPLRIDLAVTRLNVTLWTTSKTLNVGTLWRHVCLTSRFGIFLVYFDGVTQGTQYGERYIHDSETLITIVSSEFILLKLSSLHVWDKFLDERAIRYMSYKCGDDRGNIGVWENLINNITIATSPPSPVIYYNSTSCEGKQGDVLSVVSSLSIQDTSATIISKYFNLSLGWLESPVKCLKFRYRLWGPGARVLRFYQVLDNKRFPWRPIWMDDVNNSSGWKDGQAMLSATAGYQIVVKGEVSSSPGLISIGALYTTDGYCTVKPSTANRACNEIFTNATGLIASPYYPSYYSNNINCNWTIKAKQDHIIRLDIEEFQLEMSLRCENDSIDIYDGDVRIGRYCGIRYPPIIQSTTNHVSIVMKSNSKIQRTGFVANYKIIKGTKTSKECTQDCPTDCECRRLEDGRIIISSRNLVSVPDRLHRDTSIVLFTGNKIFNLERNTFHDLQQLSLIDISFNRITKMEKKSFSRLPSINTIRLNMNFLKEIPDDVWFDIETLQTLDLGENLISTIAVKAFSTLRNLTVLSLRENFIQSFDVGIFRNNTNLTHLYLHGNILENIPKGLFRNQRRLKVLQLHNNKIKTFRKLSFRGLHELERLTLHNNYIKESSIPEDAFSELQNLKYLKLDSFILCCYAKKTIPTLTCDSQGNSFSSCEDMLKSTVIRVGIWIQGVLASFGNLAVIVWWSALSLSKANATKRTGKASVQPLLLRNLAFADMLMGIYLLYVGIQDALWRGEYVDHDVDWRSGTSCQIAGAISTLSSEVSVMMLAVLTADRFSTIVFDFRAKRLNQKTACCICSIVWVLGFVIAFTPLFATSYFNDETSGFSFYGRSTVCLPLQLSSDKPAGWEYSVAVFMAFNGVVFLFILVAYVAIFLKVRQSAKRVKSGKDSTSLGLRVLFIVMTDFCCWMPVIVIGILSLVGKFKDPSGEIYSWIAVFVLPVNSSINPILYTFATPQGIKIISAMRCKRGNSKSGKNQGKELVGDQIELHTREKLQD